MKRLVALLAISLLIQLLVRADELQRGDLVAICGDSITEQKQYSVFMQTYLIACQPKPDLRAMQFGWGGEVSWGFFDRLDNDVLRYKPTVATTCYGMNDGGYAPLSDERATKCRKAMTDIVKKLKDSGVRFIVVGSPGCVDADTFRKDPAAAEVYNKTLSQLRDIAREVATQQGAAFTDVHSTMIQVMTAAKQKYGSEYHVGGPDGVHPMPNGHLVMAYAFLRALGCDGNIGTITMDMSSGKSETSSGHKIIESSAGIVEVQSSKYPFCFWGDPASPDSTRGVIEFMPFNSDLNRFMLVVKNAPSQRLKVTWGETSKEFSKEQLESGINLAAEFLDNPFSAPFKEVEKTVHEQQSYETPMIKLFVHNLDLFKKMVPSESESLDRLANAMGTRDREMQKASSAAVKPVRHRIVVEPLGERGR